MSETPEFAPANVPAAETPAEAQAGRRSETVETRAEAQNETHSEAVEGRPEAPSEALAELQIELQNTTRIEEAQTAAQAETPNDARAETPTEAHAETPVEKPTDMRVATRPEPQSVPLNDRPFRVKLRGSVLVLIRLPNKRQLRAALHQLSTTGGVINLDKPLDEKIEVELIFHIDRTTIHGKAQMLFPMWATQGWMQPFRFVDLADADRGALQENLRSFVGNLAKSTSAAG